MRCVFSVSSADYAKLKKVVEENPYSDRSFAHVGYTIRESKSVGLEPGNYILTYECEDDLAKELAEKLKAIESAKELQEPEKSNVVKKIREEEEAAAAGFGSIFG